jgi:hypothetical protein
VRADDLLDERTLPHDQEAIERALARWPPVRCCYEAGPTGYGLARYLRSGAIACEVVTPGLVPVRPGERVKTDARDARKLARLHAGGLFEPIAVPSEQVEALRDLVRAREDARVDRMRDRHRMSKFLLRHGLRVPGKSWASRVGAGWGRCRSSRSISAKRSRPTCTQWTSSTGGSSSSNASSITPRCTARGPSLWRGCAACAGSTR